jgi:hypothetical protein
MKKILTLLILTISLSGTSQEWRQFGSLGDIPPATDHAMTVLENNRPVVAYIDEGNNEPYVAVWNGELWDLLPEITPTEPAENIDIVSIGTDFYVSFSIRIKASIKSLSGTEVVGNNTLILGSTHPTHQIRPQ